MTVLVIRRQASPQDREYPYRVMVDGRQRAEVGDDATVQIGLTPGEHRVSLRVKWCGSRELPFTIQPGEIVRMQCRPNVRPLLALLYITLWRNRYIFLETVKSWT
ncbi:MAG TPA: hypothetical protein VFU13_05055 [Steroidobacteraceae bacterium]|nr:hypothetical protein [Steroidobacteraceae bacterium]